MHRQNQILIPETAEDGSRRMSAQSYRMTNFAEWLEQAQRNWFLDKACIAAYRDYLLNDDNLSVASANAYLSTVRKHLRELPLDNRFPDLLELLMAKEKISYPQAHRKVTQHIVEIANPTSTQITYDRVSRPYVYLTVEQAEDLLETPDRTTLRGARDTALIALMVCLGLREGEVAALDVKNIHSHAIQVPEGRGCQPRNVNFADFGWIDRLLHNWLYVASIETGPVFRGFYRGHKRIRPHRITTQGVIETLREYPLEIDGQEVRLRPGDLRASSARFLFNAGAPMELIQSNLGYASADNVLKLIGTIEKPASNCLPRFDCW